MNNSIKIFLLVLLSGCCSNIDCADLMPILNFSYLSKSGDDLLSGNTKKYEIADFKIYSIGPSGNEQLAKIDLVTRQGSESFCAVLFMSQNERWFLELNGSVRDTLDLKYKTNEGRCCGVQIWIDELYINGNFEESIGLPGTDVIKLVENN